MKRKNAIFFGVILMTSLLINGCSSEKNESMNSTNQTKENQIIENTILESDLKDKLYDSLFDNQKGKVSIESFSERNDDVELIVNVYWQDGEKECKKIYNMDYKKDGSQWYDNQWYIYSIDEVECNYKPLKGPNDELILRNEDCYFKYAKKVERIDQEIDLEKGIAKYLYTSTYNFNDILEQECKTVISYCFTDNGEWEYSSDDSSVEYQNIVQVGGYNDFLNVEYHGKTYVSSGYILCINEINFENKKINATLITPSWEGPETRELSGDFTTLGICGYDGYYHTINDTVSVQSDLFDKNDPSFIFKIEFNINSNKTVDDIDAFVSYDYTDEGNYIGNCISLEKKN